MNETEVIILGLGGKLWSLDADWRKQDETRNINELQNNSTPIDMFEGDRNYQLIQHTYEPSKNSTILAY